MKAHHTRQYLTLFSDLAVKEVPMAAGREGSANRKLNWSSWT